MAENSTISEMAEKVSDELFSFFRWEKVPLVDQNFPCLKESTHKPTDKEQDHTHPVDVVFHYIDPYTGKRVFFNTDLKSYAKRTINSNSIRKALNSLAYTIACASLSDVWKTRYNLNSDSYEVRGMLFVYNHDGGFDDQFYKFFDKETDADVKSKEKKIRPEGLKINKDQFIHIVEPSTINYMTTIISDIKDLKSKDSFPRKDYSFFYPELSLHRQHVADQYKRCANIEMICSPFLIIEHGETIIDGECYYEKGYLIYYNNRGESYYEFLYLFDILSKYQILNKEVNIRIRCANRKRSPDIKSNFNKAINAYVTAWGFDDAKKAQLEKIEMATIETYQTCFSQTELGWRD